MKLLDIKSQLYPQFNVKVIPGASTSRIKLEPQAEGLPLIRLYVTAPPEDGKANKAVIALLAKELGIAKSSIEILRGETAQHKLIGLSE